MSVSWPRSAKGIAAGQTANATTESARIEVWGLLPVTLEGAGDNKQFTVKLRNDSGEMVDTTFEIYRDQNRRIRINVPEDIDQVSEPRKRRR